MSARTRTRGELTASLHDAEPERRLTAITVDLFTINDRLSTIENVLAASRGDDDTTRLRHEQAKLLLECSARRAELATERQRLEADRLHGLDPASVVEQARTDRTVGMVHYVINQRPIWLTRWLSKLATGGQLNQLTDHDVMAAISQIASYRDELHVADPEPLGPPPPTETDHFRDWS